MNIAILASGNGSNFQAIVEAIKLQKIPAQVKLLITDKQDAFVRTRAKRLGVKDLFICPKQFKSRLDYDKEIVAILKKNKINLVVLAGYMRILSGFFINQFKNKILNIHPALLPAFKGIQAITQAYDYGCKLAGVTVHFVDEEVDHGPIILQEIVKIKDKMTLKQLEDKIHALEHKLYPLAINLFVGKQLIIKNRRVFIKSK